MVVVVRELVVGVVDVVLVVVVVEGGERVVMYKRW